MRSSTYTTANGTVFDVSGRNGISLASLGALGWEYAHSSGLPSRDARKMSGSLSFTFRADRSKANMLMGLCACDLDAGTPGVWEVDGWKLECYLLAASAPSYSGRNRLFSVDILAPDPVWRHETRIEFVPQSGSAMEVGGYDFEHDFPYDLGGEAHGQKLDVAAAAPCDFRLTVYGYAAKPNVIIGGNRYGVDVVVPEGGILVVDSTRKKSMKGDSVVLYDKYGNGQDVFPKRVKGAEGSGSYIFERIARGTHDVTWDQGWGFTLDLIERAVALPWT